ncbi:hypothetical protein POTOM_025002 [Populus tomentosa]|uniref:Bifunctional lysine-specific demethylase and histidyl-hydroxylase n=1 Tax=Populus tomentosa TaxID=118781 RepID=A0A8X8CN98_POPTO|nr:hypothetical protein POTOM_025002 [Populus tomentosa]
MEMNELVALDVGRVKGLILMLVIRKRKLSVAACDAILDLSTTLIGRQRLLKFSALEKLFIPISIYDGKKMVPASSILLVSLYNEDERSIACARITFKEDGHSVSLLHNAITLINTCNIEQLEKIPSKLSEKFLDSMKRCHIYLTPPYSQGLDRHCDDHCVFVCQLFGTKQWTIYSQPRLYDPLNREQCFVEENSLAGYRKFLLREGDILYIPRGFPHEACTHDCGSSDLARFSLHVTLGIEVEPPFEWEGFAHVALHCWYQTQKQLHRASAEPLSGILDLMPVTLLHLMIELIGASDSTLREASLVGAHFCL